MSRRRRATPGHTPVSHCGVDEHFSSEHANALANLREALELYFEDEPVPEAGEPPIIASVDIAA